MGPASEYEKVRADNIARNELFLAELGLSANAPIRRARSPLARPPERGGNKRKRGSLPENALRRSTRSSKKGEDTGESKEEVRKSAERGHDFIVHDDEDDDEYQETRKKISAKELRKVITESSEGHDAEISNQAIVHCIDRINSMSEKALRSRIKTIARAKGKNAREKLLVFQYALQETGMEGLSKECVEALRLL